MCCSQILTALSLLNMYNLLIFKVVLFNINLMQATHARPYIFSFVPVATLRKWKRNWWNKLRKIYNIFYSTQYIQVLLSCNQYKILPMRILHFFHILSEICCVFTLTTHLSLEKLHFKCSLAMCGYHIAYHMSNVLYVITTMKRTSTRLQRFVVWLILLLILPCMSYPVKWHLILSPNTWVLLQSHIQLPTNCPTC